MATAGAFEAKTHLPGFIKGVEQGETITITKHGKPLAMLVPVNAEKVSDAREIINEIRKFRGKHCLNRLSIREMIKRGTATIQ